MGIPTLISTATETNAASIDITSGIDSTYDEYMFVFTDLGPATDAQNFRFQVNAASQSGFNEVITSTAFYSYHNENNAAQGIAYHDSQDQANGTSYQTIAAGVGNGSFESCAGILHLFSPSNTTFVKHFYSRMSSYESAARSWEEYVAGYINTTSAIDEISFKFASGNFDGVIQMYGIS